MKLLILPLLSLILLAGCDAQRAAEIAQQAEQRVEYLQSQVVNLAEIAKALPEGSDAQLRALAALEAAKDSLEVARLSAETARTTASRIALGGNLLDIALGIAVTAVPAGVGIYTAVQRARKSYGALRQTISGVEKAKIDMEAHSIDALHRHLALSQDRYCKGVVDKVQGRA